MSESMAVFDNQHDFLAALETVPAARWLIQPGVTLWFTAASVRPASLILTLAPARRYPGMIRQILQRRFLEADALSACSLSLDGQQNLRLYRTLSIPREPVAALADLWRLAGLPPR